MEESIEKSAEWSGEDTEELVSEEEDAIAGGEGEADRLLTVTAGESAGSDTRDGPGGAVAGGGATADATSTAADEAEACGYHGSTFGARERIAGWRVLWSGRKKGGA